jgi:hypothetical protein
VTNSLPRLLLALRALTAIFLIVALSALVWKPAPAVTEIPVAGLNAGVPERLSANGGQVELATIIDANVFSSSRKAPAQRYQPFAPLPETAPVPDVAPPDASAAEDAVPQFFGTIAGPRGTFALLRLEAGETDAQMYREGEGAGGYRVEKINEQSVVLSGPKGRIVLRLIRPGGPTS